MTGRLRVLGASILTVAAILFLFRNYYGGNGLLFGDANFMWSPSLLHAELAQFLHVWRPAASGGTSGAIANESQLFILFQALFSPLGIPLSTVLVFPFLLCIGAFSFYAFARGLGANRLGSFAAAAFFIANPWTCDQMLAGHVSILAAVCFSPLVFWTFLQLRLGRAGFGFLLLAACAVELALDPRTSIFVFSGVVIAGIASRARRVLWFSLAAPFFAVACNGAWTLLYALSPYANLVPFFYPPVEDFSVFSWFSDFWHSLVLSAYFIHFSWTVADRFGPWSFAPWYASLVGVLLIPLWAAAKLRLSYWLGACAIVIGIIFTMGTHALPPALGYEIFTHVPLMSLLREPVKFSYLTAIGASVLIALAMTRLRFAGRAVLTLAVAIAIFPIFTANFSVPEGYGFQEFTTRPAYLRMLHFLEARRAKEDFRIAVLPPWLAEQSLAKGQFYTDNPFVLQSEIPVLDAKLVNTANATSERAWQAFSGIYAGTDAHPAATLGEFGVKYIVVPSGIALSPAAALTPFASADDALDAAIVNSDRNFVQVYADGGNRIFQNMLFKPAVRTTRTPIVAGDVPMILRQSLPAATFGDAFGAGVQPQPLPAGAVSISNSAVRRCLDTRTDLPARNAYYDVTKHADWTNYWVAGDWTVNAPDSYRSRILQRFPLPFAYTESRSVISVRVGAARAGEVYAEAATTAALAFMIVRIDGGRETPVRLTSGGLNWIDLGPVKAGEHTVDFSGSAAGTILRRVVADGGACGQPQTAAPRSGNFYLPGPTRSVTVNVGQRLTTVTVRPLALASAADNPPAWNVPTPSGAVAATWDYGPITSGRAFPTFSGYHRLAFLAPSGQPLPGTWQNSDAAKKNLTLRGSRWPQNADVTVSNIPDGQTTLIDLSLSGTLRGATIFVSAPGVRTLTLPADALKTPFLAVPYVGHSYGISVTTPANARGTLSFGADVRAAGQTGAASIFRIPADAVAVARPLRSARATVPIATYSLNAENNLQPAQYAALGVPVNAAQGLVLHLKGLSASDFGRATVTAFEDSWANLPPVKIAEVAVGARPANFDLAVPLLPYTETIAFSVLPADSKLTLSLAAASLSDSDPLAGGSIVSIPQMRTRGGMPIAVNDSQIESITFRNPGAGYLTAAFTYDPYWSIDSHPRAAQPHWEVNGFANGWRAGGGGVMTYRLQSLYSGLLVFGAVLWLAALLLFAVAQVRARRNRSIQPA